MDTYAFHIDINPVKPWAEIAISWLAESGFDAFEETEQGIIAYAEEEKLNDVQSTCQTIANWAKQAGIEVEVEVEKIQQENWNAQWESDFQPVDVEGRLRIVAPFHARPDTDQMIIEIQPQMSFGTGHHQTTWMMCKALLDFGELPRPILDMGTGTGVLAILAERLGGNEITAIDIEEWSAENTRENALRNSCQNIVTYHGDIDLIEGKEFGLILANINKNVLKSQLPHYKKSLKKGGTVVLSGFFETDAEEMIEEAAKYDLVLRKSFGKESWAALQFEWNT